MTRHAPVFAKCNTCGRKSTVSGRTIKDARAQARLNGWTYSGDTDTCDECRPGPRKDREIGYWRDATVHLLREGFNLTYRQIGMITGLSRQRIHQICQEETFPTLDDWINYTRKAFNVEITQPRPQEPEESAETDHPEGVA